MPRADQRGGAARKARCVIEVVQHHINAVGAVWDDSAMIHLYFAHPIATDLLRTVLASLSIAPAHGLIWHDAVPPVTDLELEIDVRRYARELMTLPKTAVAETDAF